MTAQLPYLVLLYSGVHASPDTGRKFELREKGTRIGHAGDTDIQLEPSVVQPEHARVYARGASWYLENLTDRQDVIVDGMAVGVHMLQKDGETFSVGDAIFAFMKGTGPWSAYHEDAERRSDTDPLLRIPNRRAFERGLATQSALLGRQSGSFGLLMIDVDHFKQHNTRVGHLGGDAILKELARRMSAQMREEDLFARWGGEEFVVLLPRTTRPQTLTFAERLREVIAETPFVVRDMAFPVTVSIGAACALNQAAAEGIVEEANKKLLEAKASGRNCVVS